MSNQPPTANPLYATSQASMTPNPISAPVAAAAAVAPPENKEEFEEIREQVSLSCKNSIGIRRSVGFSSFEDLYSKS